MRKRCNHKVLIVAVALVAVSACGAPAPRPAMVPVGAVGEYGYSTSSASSDQFEVDYVTPVLRTSLRDSSREEEIEAEKRRAYELALWRAAQIAQERDYAVFIVEESSRDADVEIDEGGYYGNRYGYAWHNNFGNPYRRYPYRHPGYYPFAYHPYAFGHYEQPRASMRVHVRLLIREAAPDEAGALDTAATIARLASAYANTTWPAR
ncbi:MAG: hypothetical protein WD711_09050 [Dongiaceae bacterium]